MWSFWDALILTTMMSVRDYYRDRERNILRVNQFKQKCIETISDNAMGILEDIKGVVEQQKTSYMSNAISTGIVQLPMYAFYLVLINQKVGVTKEQRKVIDMFYRNLTMPYSQYDFLSSIKSDNHASLYIKEFVGISKVHIGKFWTEFFRAIYRTETEEKVVTGMIEKFATIVMNFSMLGDTKSNYAETILQNFMEAVGYQVSQCRTLPKDKIDMYGDAGYVEHYHAFEKEYTKIVKLTKSDEEGLPAFDIYPYFCMGVVYHVVNRSTQDRQDKASCIDYVMDACNMDFGYTGIQIIDSVEKIDVGQDDELGWWINNLTSTESEGVSFWQIMATLGGKCKDYNYETNLIPELCGFLIGMDGELAKKYPMSGFGDIAKPYLMEKLQDISDMIDAIDDNISSNKRQSTLETPTVEKNESICNNKVEQKEDTKSEFEDDYIKFRTELKIILDASGYDKKISEFNNIMAAVYLYEMMLILDHLIVSENKKIDIYKELMKKYQLELAAEEDVERLYHIVKAKIGGWEELIPSAAIPNDEYVIGSFWILVIRAIMEAEINLKKIMEVLRLHKEYVLSLEKEFTDRYDIMDGLHEAIAEYVQSSMDSVPEYLISLGALSYDEF